MFEWRGLAGSCPWHGSEQQPTGASAGVLQQQAMPTWSHMCRVSAAVCQPHCASAGTQQLFRPRTPLPPVSVCRQCAAGHVSAGGYSIECDACSESTPPVADNSACGCRAGFRVNSTEPLSCVQCESPLTYTAKANRAMVCQQCTPYSYATEDFTSCVCGGGYYAAALGQDGSEWPLQSGG